MRVFRGFVILKPQKPDLKCPPLRSGQYLAEKLFCVCRGLRKNEPSQALRASSPEGRAKTVEGTLLASPFERLPPVGGRCRAATKRDKVSPKVTERAHPLPCGELPPQRLRGLQIGEARKMLLAKRLAFFRFDLCFGIIKGEQPLIRCGVGGVQRKGGGSRNTPPYLWPSGASWRRCLL